MDHDGAAKDGQARAAGLRAAGREDDAIAALREAACSYEIPPGDLCLQLARSLRRIEDVVGAERWIRRAAEACDSFTHWQAAAALLAELPADSMPQPKRTVKLAVLGSYTTTQWVPMLHLAARCVGIALETHECPFGQYRQEIVDADSAMYRFDPDAVVIAAHSGELAIPELVDDPSQVITDELDRWRSLWELLASRTPARIIQHNFAIEPVSALGHLSARLNGSRPAMISALNAALGEAAGTQVAIVDCERLAATLGKERWFDDKYWLLAKQAVSLEALPLLARHTVAVLGASFGLSRKCLVLDLDNTLWGGVIGEDGLAGIQLGAGPVGEAFVALQQYILALKAKGVILAVCSKNNEADAREPFEKHPDMQISLDDIAMFVANWEPKPHNIEHIARRLDIGLDSMVFLDDNPAERDVVRRMLPEVDVITLPEDPMRYGRALANYLMFETSSLTAEDSKRTEQYKARAEIVKLESQATNIDEFHRSLQMSAQIEPFDDLHLPRIAQLIGKSNQFNLTTRRHGEEQLRSFMSDPRCVHFHLKLRDRLTDHGLVSLMIAFQEGDVLDIDTWLMSCRVIGRTVEAEMLQYLCGIANERHCSSLRGTHIPTARNALVQDLFDRFGFEHVGAGENDATIWEYDLAASGPIHNEFIERRAQQQTTGATRECA